MKKFNSEQLAKLRAVRSHTTRPIRNLKALDAAWLDFNNRRAELIDRELKTGLNPKEFSELMSLQDAADTFLNEVHPLPTVHTHLIPNTP